MEKQRQQIMLDLDKLIWLNRQKNKKNEKSLSVTINRILSEYQFLVDKFEEQEQKAGEEPSYKDVRNQQMRQRLGVPINDQTKSKVELRK